VQPVLTIGPVELSTYVLMLSLGGSLGFWLTYREAARTPAEAGRMLALAAIAFTAGLVGARGLSWAMHRSFYAGDSWWSLLAVWDRGGMALYGGLALAVALGLAYIRLSGLAAWEASDRLVLAWVPFLVFVRIGCFLNGCCYGQPTTSPLGQVAGGSSNAVNFGIPSHPAQLYDAAALLAIFGLLSWMRRRRRYAGQLTVTFLVLHSGFRLFHETLRGDPRLAWRLDPFGTVSFNQLVAVALLAIALGAHAHLRRSGRATVPEPDRAPSF
jgi:phosphatidylglycerol:prolipoprotein diacylglycerol transferase